jgi:hypothetical protein
VYRSRKESAATLSFIDRALLYQPRFPSAASLSLQSLPPFVIPSAARNLQFYGAFLRSCTLIIHGANAAPAGGVHAYAKRLPKEPRGVTIDTSSRIEVPNAG